MHERLSPWRRAARQRLYRVPAHGRIAGVCAGIGEWLDVSPFLVRLAFIAGLITMPPLAVLAYAVAAFALPVRPAVRCDPDGMDMAGGPRAVPEPDPAGRTLADLSARLRDQEKRIVSLEAYVATREFELNRAIRELDRPDQNRG